jgi:multidrug transporter EmrE-like cation transporter
VPFSVQLGLALALATSVASLLGFLLKHRGAIESPDVDWRRPVVSSLRLFRSRAYALGMAVAMGSWGLHVAALSLAPISLVQTVIAGGLVLLTVLANRFFGQEVDRREWIGVGMTAAGLAFLAATIGSTGDSAHSHYTSGTLVFFLSALTIAGTIAAVIGWQAVNGASLVALSAGLLWGASDTSIKALSGTVDRGVLVIVNPLAIVILLLSLYGLLVSTRSLQRGRAVPVIATTSAAANVVTIAAGPIVFGEPMPASTLGLSVRLLAFALVVTAAALTPPPQPRDQPVIGV